MEMISNQIKEADYPAELLTNSPIHIIKGSKIKSIHAPTKVR
jgi:hypothetical protein